MLFSNDESKYLPKIDLWHPQKEGLSVYFSGDTTAGGFKYINLLFYNLPSLLAVEPWAVTWLVKSLYDFVTLLPPYNVLYES